MLPDGTRKVSLTRAQFDDINVVMKNFFQRTKCAAIMLADSSGLLLARCGSMDPNNLSLLSTLAAADYAATTEMARLIGEKVSFKMHFYEGETNNVYVTGVGKEFFLVIVFSKNTTFGMVRVLTAKTSELLLEIVNRSPNAQDLQDAGKDAHVRQNLSDEGFRDELSSRLDAILAKTDPAAE